MSLLLVRAQTALTELFQKIYDYSERRDHNEAESQDTWAVKQMLR